MLYWLSCLPSPDVCFLNRNCVHSPFGWLYSQDNHEGFQKSTLSLLPGICWHFLDPGNSWCGHMTKSWPIRRKECSTTGSSHSPCFVLYCFSICGLTAQWSLLFHICAVVRENLADLPSLSHTHGWRHLDCRALAEGLPKTKSIMGTVWDPRHHLCYPAWVSPDGPHALPIWTWLNSISCLVQWSLVTKFWPMEFGQDIAPWLSQENPHVTLYSPSYPIFQLGILCDFGSPLWMTVSPLSSQVPKWLAVFHKGLGATKWTLYELEKHKT